jgi:hypothetical protein
MAESAKVFALDARRDAIQSVPPGLSGGDGGSTSDGMEARVKVLEDKFDRIESKLDGISKDIGELKVGLAHVRGKLDSMPSTITLLGFVLAVLGIAGLAKYFAP